MPDFVLLGDRGYLSQSIQLDLFQTVNIKLETLKKANKMIISHNLISLENREKGLQHYFHNSVTSSELETIVLKILNVFKQEF